MLWALGYAVCRFEFAGLRGDELMIIRLDALLSTIHEALQFPDDILMYCCALMAIKKSTNLTTSAKLLPPPPRITYRRNG